MEKRADLAPIFSRMRAGLDEAGRKALDEALISGNLTADHPIFYIMVQLQAQQKAIEDLIKSAHLKEKQPDEIAIKTSNRIDNLDRTTDFVAKKVIDMEYDVGNIRGDVGNIHVTINTINERIAKIQKEITLVKVTKNEGGLGDKLYTFAVAIMIFVFGFLSCQLISKITG
jgi:hypothetical protein